MYSYKRLPDKNEDGAALEGQEPFSSAKHPGLPSLTPHEEAVAAFWNAGYGNCGRMWGCGASSTAIALINAFNKERHRFAERIEIAEVGCGYGRDAFAFAQAGFDVVGSDIARQALILAHQDYKKMSRHAVPGSVQFLHGTIRTVAAAAVETFDGIASHRTLHLMAKEEILSFARLAAELVRPAGFISIGARSPKDFDPRTMEWVEGQERETARYKDPSRDGQLITFLDEAFLRRAFEPDFEVRCSEGVEEERVGNNAVTGLIYMAGSRRPLSRSQPLSATAGRSIQSAQIKEVSHEKA